MGAIRKDDDVTLIDKDQLKKDIFDYVSKDGKLTINDVAEALYNTKQYKLTEIQESAVEVFLTWLLEAYTVTDNHYYDLDKYEILKAYEEK